VIFECVTYKVLGSILSVYQFWLVSLTS